MAYILADNLSSPTVNFVTGGENPSFPFTNVFNNNPSDGFKSLSSTQPTIILTGFTIQQFNAVGFYIPNDCSFACTVHTSTTADETSASSANWVLANFNRTGNNSTGNQTSLSVSDNDTSSYLFMSNNVVNVRSIKITFLNLQPSVVINHIQIGNADQINIVAPYTPNMMRSFELTTKRNNKGNPLITDKIPTATKLNLKTEDLSPTDMKTLVDSVETYIIDKPFLVCTSYDLTSEVRGRAYFCILDKGLDSPKFKDSTIMSWTIKALGYK